VDWAPCGGGRIAVQQYSPDKDILSAGLRLRFETKGENYFCAE